MFLHVKQAANFKRQQSEIRMLLGSKTGDFLLFQAPGLVPSPEDLPTLYARLPF